MTSRPRAPLRLHNTQLSLGQKGIRVRTQLILPKQTKSIPASPTGLSPVSPQGRVGSPKSSFLTRSPYFHEATPKTKATLAKELRVLSSSTRRKPHIRSSTQLLPELGLPPKPHTRTVSKPDPSLLLCENVVSSCAYKTRTGEAGGKPKKQNQDALIIAPILGAGQYLFAVCDGHGTFGHEVSAYIKDQLPKQMISAYLSQSTATSDRLGLALQEAVFRVAGSLGRTGIDTMFSGSTCVTVAIQGRTLLCANVGDSRAILVSSDGNSWKVTELSSDHKPDDPLELTRILAQGGRVSPYRSATGEPIGPARVWMKSEDIPGLAMSRSIGDLVASRIGVSSEPEITERILTPEDKMVIIASDGLWEFIQSDEVGYLASAYWSNRDLEGCCDRLVQEALSRWRKEDEGIDDITVLTVFLEVPESR